jgi:hypothetical protein
VVEKLGILRPVTGSGPRDSVWGHGGRFDLTPIHLKVRVRVGD